MATPVRRQQVDVAGGTEVSLDVTIGSLPARLIRVQASLPPAGGAGAPHQYGTNDPLVQAGAPGPPGTPGSSQSTRGLPSSPTPSSYARVLAPRSRLGQS